MLLRELLLTAHHRSLWEGWMQGNGAVEGALGNTLGWEEEFPPQQSGVTEQSLEAHPIS